MIQCASCGALLAHIDQACFKCLPGFYLRSTLHQRQPPKVIVESNPDLPPDPRDAHSGTVSQETK